MINADPSVSAASGRSLHPASLKLHHSLLLLIAVFGHVIDGLDVLDRMEKVPGDAKDRPKQEMKLDRITIHANPLAT